MWGRRVLSRAGGECGMVSVGEEGVRVWEEESVEW